MSEAGDILMDVSKPARVSKDDDDSGFKEKDSWYTCSNTNSPRDSAEDDEEPSSSKRNGPLSKSCESPETKQNGHVNSEPFGKRVALSRRGGRGGKSNRLNGRGGPKKKKAEGQSDNGLQFRQQQQNDQPDFHSWFVGGMSASSNLPSTSQLKEEGLNNPLPAQGFLSREAMLQLSANINNGFFYISNAFELLKQSQLELIQAKNTLERIYQSQHGEFANPFTDLQSTEGGSNGKATGDSHRLILDDNVGNRDAERFQVQLDPFDFMEPQIPVIADLTNARDVNTERGSKREGRGGHRGRPRRPKREWITNYDSKLAKKGIRHLVCRLGEFAESADGRNLRVPAVVLHDLQHILRKKDEIKPNTYSASKVEQDLENVQAKVKAAPSKSKEKTEVMEDDSSENEKPEDDHDPPQSSLKQVSPISNSTLANDENEVSAPDRKEPVETTNAHSSIAPQAEEKPVHVSKKKHKLPHWRQMRLDPAILKRVHERLKLMQKAALASEKESQSVTL